MKRLDWKTVPIKELYEGLYDGPHATPKLSDSGPVFLGIKNVTDDGRLDLAEIRHIAEDDYAAWTRRVEPHPGDLVFTYEATLNRYALIPNGFRGCLGRRMALIRTDPRRVDVRFLLYYFFTEEWRAVIRKNMLTGATVDAADAQARTPEGARARTVFGIKPGRPAAIEDNAILKESRVEKLREARVVDDATTGDRAGVEYGRCWPTTRARVTWSDRRLVPATTHRHACLAD